jgi:hypothetical protein
VKKLLKKTLPIVGTFFLFIVLATAGMAAAHQGATTAAAPPITVSVIFENGLSAITENQGVNFTALINITNSPPIDFFSVKIHWDPSLIELKDSDTDLDVVGGGFMLFAGPSYAGTHLATGTLDDISGYTTSGSRSGNGTLFTMAFHTKALSSGSNIAIIGMNTDTYLQLSGDQVNITDTVNGSLIIVIPEFPVSALLPVFLGATTVAIVAATVSSRKRRILPRVSQHP